MKYVVFEEPDRIEDQDGNFVPVDAVVHISIEEAIRRQRKAAKQHKGYDPYKSDKEALDDFIVIHWAWIEGE